MTALLADNPNDWRNRMQEMENKKRREDEENNIPSSGMCPSIVRYARPQKARSAAGEWKYIVNTGQHTQTLRLEKCTYVIHHENIHLVQFAIFTVVAVHFDRYN